MKPVLLISTLLFTFAGVAKADYICHSQEHGNLTVQSHAWEQGDTAVEVTNAAGQVTTYLGKSENFSPVPKHPKWDKHSKWEWHISSKLVNLFPYEEGNQVSFVTQPKKKFCGRAGCDFDNGYDQTTTAELKIGNYVTYYDCD